MPTPKQFEKLSLEAPRREASAPLIPKTPERPEPPKSPEAPPMPEGYWQAILNDPRAHSTPSGVPIQNRRLSEIPRHILRVACRRCDRIVEIQMVDAVRLYGKHAVWKEVGMMLLGNTCSERTGSRDDGCWPAFEAP
jgi:hypothetical protein